MADHIASVPSSGLVTNINCDAGPITASANDIDIGKGIHCNVTGDYTLQLKNSSTSKVYALVAGQVYPYQVLKFTAGTGNFNIVW